MANYGRGWDDGYGGQSAEAIDAYQERQEIEAGQLRNRKVNNMTQIENLTALRDVVQAGKFVQTAECATMLKACGFPAQMVECFIKATILDMLDDAVAFQKQMLPGYQLNIASGYTHVIPPQDNGDQAASTGEGKSMAVNTVLATLNGLIAIAAP